MNSYKCIVGQMVIFTVAVSLGSASTAWAQKVSPQKTPQQKAVPQERTKESLLYQHVFIKDEPRAEINSGQRGNWRHLDLTGQVLEIKGDELRVDLAWLKRNEVRTQDEARKFYEEEVRKHPDSAASWRGLALAKLVLKPDLNTKEDYQSALSDLNESLRLDPDSAASLRYRGLAQLNLGEYERALSDYDASLKQDANNPAVYRERAWLMHATGKTDAAMQDCDRAISLDPFHASNHFNKASIQYWLGLYAEAFNGFSQVTRLEPKVPDGYVFRSYCQMNFGDYSSAENDLSKAIDLDPQKTIAYINRGMCRNCLRDHAGAIADFTKVIELGEALSQAYQLRGATKAMVADYEGAIEDCEAALRHDPKYISAHNVIVACCYRTKQYELALPHLDALIADGTIQKTEMLLFRAFVHELREEYVMAARDFDEATKLAPANASCYRAKATLLTTCANTYIRDADKAAKLLAQAEKLEPDNPLTHAAKACLLALQGDYKSAIALQKKALEDKDYAADQRSLLGAADAKARIAAWEKGELWTYKPTPKLAKTPQAETAPAPRRE